MKGDNKLDQILNMLEDENINYANVLTSYIKNQEKETKLIGFVGDDLVGKSTVINMVLGANILPTTVIPSNTEIILKYGVIEHIYDENGKMVDDTDISQLFEKNAKICIETDNSILKDNNLVFKEFHGLLNKKSISDMSVMAEVYRCDAIVMVMSAEHLFSETECSFIDNYIKYVGSSHMLIIINKLSSVGESEVEHVLEYAKRQINNKYPMVRWTVYDSHGNSNIFSKFNIMTISEAIPQIAIHNEIREKAVIKNLLQYISEQLSCEIETLQSAKTKSKDEIEQERTIRKKQKALEQTNIEIAIVEFQKRRNETIGSVDAFIKNLFENLQSSILNQYTTELNKYTWYENNIEALWREEIYKLSKKADAFVSNRTEKDVAWLNDFLKTSLYMNQKPIDVDAKNILSNDKIIPYDNYRHFAPIGIGGGVIIGYCLFRIVGAVVGLGGGLLAYSYFGMKEATQDEDIKKHIRNSVSEVSLETRRLTKQELEALYDEIISEFKKESFEIIESKYAFDEMDYTEYDHKINAYKNIIKKIEEV